MGVSRMLTELFYWAHKVLPLLFLPTGVVAILVIASIATRRQRYAVGALILFLALSNQWACEQLIRFANGPAVHARAIAMPTADAIVVLGEGREVAPGDAHFSEWTDGDRFWGGIDLKRADRAPYLVFTGGTAPDVPNAPLEGQVLKEYAEKIGIASNAILVSDRVYTTDEEAQAIEGLLHGLRRPPLKEGVKAEPKRDALKILLVTSAYHMPRARLLFEHRGFDVIPYPVDFKIDADRTFSPGDFIPRALWFSRSEMIIRELEGRWYYQLLARFFWTHSNVANVQ